MLTIKICEGTDADAFVLFMVFYASSLRKVFIIYEMIILCYERVRDVPKNIEHSCRHSEPPHFVSSNASFAIVFSLSFVFWNKASHYFWHLHLSILFLIFALICPSRIRRIHYVFPLLVRLYKTT